ncbi:hypothetical protein BC939DRAFT_61773 [Gamsiella multidivaricata]|uniref:uncharacterized protein n=1 Tax=Gamsiella multidivaricata TaxID=101098 RepID=UPI002220F0B7|nr:uncharacterized protein BC939DRAFT_61773 [Gamsiella multidivaricata]KAI7828625.1 hypothetical protein BC939DRAFT_61773 [Gamsiella multidivaricata]
MGPKLLGREINEEWPLWLPVMHGIIWVYASILSVVSLLHPRLSNPYRLTTHLDIIYLTTAGGGLIHFLYNNFGRPIGLWTLDDQVSGLSALVSGSMLTLTLATKPLVSPQPFKGPEKRSRGVISPETRSSLYARIAFTWLHPMVIKSFRSKLQETDVWAIDKSLRIKTNFQHYLENRRPTVFVTMLYLFRLDLAQQYVWALAWTGLSMVAPFVVFKLLEFAQDISTYNRNEAMFYIAVLLVSIVVRSAVLQRGLHMGQRIGTKAMGMASGLIYEKMSLRKDMDPVDYDITDLMGVDVKHIGHGWRHGFYLMIYPTMFILATIQLYGYIGHSAWAGGLAVIAWYPISALASFLFSGRFDAAPPKMERSGALVSDFLANLKAIKYLGWEEILLSKVLKAREEERKLNSKTSQPVMALISVPLGGDLIHAFVVIIILSVFSLYFHQLLTPALLFTILILVDIQTSAINSLPAVIITLKEMLDSVVRVNDFLGDDENERDTAVIRDREMARRANIPIIGFVNATFVWPVAKPPRHSNELIFVEEPEDSDDCEDGDRQTPSNKKLPENSRQNASQAKTNWIVRTLSLFGYSLPIQPAPYLPPNAHQKYGTGLGSATASEGEFVLKNLNLSFPPGQVSLVTGTRRSGKSALLLALIGEMTRVSGKIYLPRKDYYHGKQGYGSDIAYVAQDPWLEIGGSGSITGGSTGRSTIRDTVLFGTPMDEERYNEVLRACVLEDELKGLSKGDMTIIGDKRVIWSMSLKQRISLARAIYSDVSHILMDDCLSFVDLKSRHFIWKNCILGPLTQNKTRILVSNQFHVKTYLNDVDFVVGLDQGIVLGHGSVRDVLSQGWIRQAPGSTSIPTTIVPGASVPANMGLLPPRMDQPQQILADSTPFNAHAGDLRPSKSTNLPLNKMSSLSDYDDLDSTLSRETAAGFKVGWTTFGTYIFSLGTVLFLLSAFMSLFLSQALFVVRIGWLGIWAENEAWDGGVPLQTTIHERRYRNIPSDDAPTQPTITHYDYIMIFAALAGARALFVIANAFFLRSGASKGADRIYARLLQSIAAARLTVFEAHSEKAATSLPGDSGGLFSKDTINGLKDCFQRDLSGLDVKLAKEFWQFASDFLAMTLILVVLALIMPFMLVPAGAVLFVLSSVALLGLDLSKEMHRMAIRADRMNKDQFKHTFRGLATIRGYGLERRAIKAGIAQVEVYLKTTYFGACADRWLHWKVELLGAFVPFSCAIMILQKIENLDPVLMGLAMYLSLQFSDRVLDSLLGYGRIRNRLQWALERTRRYVQELNSIDNKEAPKVVPSKQPPAGWPHSGAIEYVHYASSRSEDFHDVGILNRTINKAPVPIPAPALAPAPATVAPGVQILSRDFPQEQRPAQNPNYQQNPVAGAPLPQDLSLSTPRDNGSVRTNTTVSAVNTVASNTSHLSAASRSSALTNGTIVGSQNRYFSTSENPHATLIPLPSPSSTFMTSTAAVPEPSAPMDQLEALNQTSTDIQTDVLESRFEAPLPPLPPSATNESLSLNSSDSHEPAAHSVATNEVGFGPITCSIQPGEKIAVVGQSKSGKIMFIQSLFRIWDSAEEERIRAAAAVNPAASKKVAQGSGPSSSITSTSYTKSPLAFWSKGKAKSFHKDPVPNLGMILVDGLDIAQMGLGDLRSRISYMSPRGTVLAGTVRFNLDPRGEHEDAELNDVLKTCFLSDRLKLDTELITPATANLSAVTDATGPTSAAAKPASRITRYRKKFFRDSRATSNKKGKDRSKDYKASASAPATIGVSSGRGLRAAIAGGGNDLAEVEQRLLQSLEEEDENINGEGIHGNDSDDDDEYEEDDTRMELDTNERQLLSLARILVHRSNVVVLDNCASKVTDLTAQRIDQIILQELKHATIISVGHRLDQIVARHNRILVLDHGKLVEFDTPMALLSKPNGAFRAICNPNGPNFSSLVSLAKKQQIQLQQ